MTTEGAEHVRQLIRNIRYIEDKENVDKENQAAREASR